MRMVCRSLVLIATIVVQIPSHAAGPRVAPVPENQRTDEQRTIAAKFSSSGIPNAVATYLHHPALADHVFPYERYASSDSTLPPRHRALVGLRTAWLTRSNYLWAHRAAESRRAGFTSGEFTRVAQGPDAAGWDAFEALVLRAADELHVDSFVSDATWNALKTFLDTRRLMELVQNVAFYNMVVRVLVPCGVELEPGTTKT